MIPKKLVTYLRGSGEQYIRATYSTVKKPVNTYSHIIRNRFIQSGINGMLSIIIRTILSSIAHSRATSNALPSGVSLSKITM